MCSGGDGLSLQHSVTPKAGITPHGVTFNMHTSTYTYAYVYADIRTLHTYVTYVHYIDIYNTY